MSSYQNSDKIVVASQQQNSTMMTSTVSNRRAGHHAEVHASALSTTIGECAICIDHIRNLDAVWTCGTCYGVMHLSCVNRWAIGQVTHRMQSEETEYDDQAMDYEYDDDEYNDGYDDNYADDYGDTTVAADDENRNENLEANDDSDDNDEEQRKTAFSPSSSSSSVRAIPWKCPLCMSVCYNEPLPLASKCFCGRKQFKSERELMSHALLYGSPSCMKTCARMKKCGHSCMHPCHAGPCPSCETPLVQSCHCGRLTTEVKCGSLTRVETRVTLTPSANGGETVMKVVREEEEEDFYHNGNKEHKEHKNHTDHHHSYHHHHHHLSCHQVCDRELACGRHRCEAVCHAGPCKRCHHRFEQMCFCGKERHVRHCPRNTTDRYNVDPETSLLRTFCCKSVCGHLLKCGHTCQRECHRDPCVKGQSPISQQSVLSSSSSSLVSLASSSSSLMSLSSAYGDGDDDDGGESNYNQSDVNGEETRDLQNHNSSSSSRIHGCKVVCTRVRTTCGHTCGHRCHPNEPCCDRLPCNQYVELTCNCERKSCNVRCCVYTGKKRQASHFIQCDETCVKIERIKKLASLRSKLDNRHPTTTNGHHHHTHETTNIPQYSSQLISWAKSNLKFLYDIEAIFDKMVAEGSSLESYPFDPMKQSKRLMLYEYASHYGLEHYAIPSVSSMNIPCIYRTASSVAPLLKLSDFATESEEYLIVMEQVEVEKMQRQASRPSHIRKNVVVEGDDGQQWVKRVKSYGGSHDDNNDKNNNGGVIVGGNGDDELFAEAPATVTLRRKRLGQKENNRSGGADLWIRRNVVPKTPPEDRPSFNMWSTLQE